ncbi:prenyltransferase/squalene oxidase repeat-containing protein [Agrobacterium vitis]|uniref:Geranylgeranyl transferase type II subunit beta n=1 Tax=Agrobacterium vitis TaxID=373 RepID=A0AAE2RFM9_AGRVI|nr:prenyltransferase/squalene oxidase repeat-containing protein [Agrobacterium vitis]MBF2717655.1 prenyltransferase [Agrobacterium vitis]
MIQPATLSASEGFRFLRTTDGGAGTGSSDLWATYAAIRTLTWLKRPPSAERSEEISSYVISCQNPDGSFSWQRGLPSDIWATFYCTQALGDIGVEIKPTSSLIDWLHSLQSPEGGFAMKPGQTPDVWATYYATRVFREIVGVPVPNVEKLAKWLSGLQCSNGGLAWNPASAGVDTRATYYAVHAKHVAGIVEPIWNVSDLVSWLQSMQDPVGGFRFGPEYKPCLWATFRATRALTKVDARPLDVTKCRDWILQRYNGRGFVRWEDYQATDVWANFSAVGALQAIGVDVSASVTAAVESTIEQFGISGGGYTYREPVAAGDALTTASALIHAYNQQDTSSVDVLSMWLRRAHMPWEDGIMYMPGRGAEVRCTLWAIASLGYIGRKLDSPPRVAKWIGELQNPDGGFGYWQGRGSDLVSTSAAVSILYLLGNDISQTIDVRQLSMFVRSCLRGTWASNIPGGPMNTSASAQASRLLWILGEFQASKTLLTGLNGRVRLGGYFEQDGGLPTLYATYQAALALSEQAQPLSPQLSRFLDRLCSPSGVIGWTPMGAIRQDPLVIPLYSLLRRKLREPAFRLPPLVL